MRKTVEDKKYRPIKIWESWDGQGENKRGVRVSVLRTLLMGGHTACLFKAGNIKPFSDFLHSSLSHSLSFSFHRRALISEKGKKDCPFALANIQGTTYSLQMLSSIWKIGGISHWGAVLLKSPFVDRTCSKALSGQLKYTFLWVTDWCWDSMNITDISDQHDNCFCHHCLNRSQFPHQHCFLTEPLVIL